MCFGRAERTGRGEAAAGFSGVGVLGCLRIDTGTIPEERVDGVEALDAAADGSEGIGAELARGCAGGFGRI